MAVSMGGGYGNGRRRAGRYKPLSEINVTPLVDVMLVLLIIFMVTAPLMSSAVNVDLPKVAASQITQDSEPLTVSIDAQGQIWLQDQKVELNDLVAKLLAISQNDKDRRIFVRGDKANQYGRVIEVMGAIVLGGFSKAALLSEPPVGLPGGALPSGEAPVPPANANTPVPAGSQPAQAPPKQGG
jgi:biopolymer transport protein TolR